MAVIAVPSEYYAREHNEDRPEPLMITGVGYQRLCGAAADFRTSLACTTLRRGRLACARVVSECAARPSSLTPTRPQGSSSDRAAGAHGDSLHDRGALADEESEAVARWLVEPGAETHRAVEVRDAQVTIKDDLERVRTRTHLAGSLQLDNELHIARDLPLRVAVPPPGPDVAHPGTVGLEETDSRIRRCVIS